MSGLAARCGCSPGKGAGAGWDAWNERLTQKSSPTVLILNRRRQFPNPINLGWLYLPQSSEGTLPEPSEWSIEGGYALRDIGELAPVLDRLILVSDEVFSIVVDDQLEVRTSVSISPETGAAEERALFTAEAIPRACFLFFPVTFLDPKFFRVPVKAGSPGEKIAYDGKEATIRDIEGNVAKGLRAVEALGVGGVNTRGMGRLRVIPIGDWS